MNHSNFLHKELVKLANLLVSVLQMPNVHYVAVVGAGGDSLVGRASKSYYAIQTPNPTNPLLTQLTHPYI